MTGDRRNGGESAHTPGPWTVAYLDKNGQAVVKAEHIEVATCWHHSVGAIEKEMHANASLIAAAPDLLAALVKLSNSYAFIKPPGYPKSDAEKQAHAAIAKATGEQS